MRCVLRTAIRYTHTHTHTHTMHRLKCLAMTSYSRATNAMLGEDKVILPTALLSTFFHREIESLPDGKRAVIQLSRQSNGEIYFYSTSCADYAAEPDIIFVPSTMYASLGLDPVAMNDPDTTAQWVSVQIGSVPRFDPETMVVTLQPQTLEFFDPDPPLETKMEWLSAAMSGLTCANKFARVRIDSYEFVISSIKTKSGEKSFNAVYLHIPGGAELEIELDCTITDAMMAEREAKRLEKERKADEEAMLSALRDQEIARLNKRRAEKDEELVIAQRARMRLRYEMMGNESDEPEEP
jgi:hypothetical protein